MKGKDKCKILKELRAQIAAANDIEWVTENCTHKGECRGTCPKCEAEVAMLERALERRRALGQTVAVAGLAVGILTTTTSCSVFDQWAQPTAGDMLPPEQTTTADKTTAATTERVEVAVDGEMVTAGEPVQVCYFTDFTLIQPRTFELKESIYFESVEGGDRESSPSGMIDKGAQFDVIGETDNFWLVSYKDGYYCIMKYQLDAYAVEVTDTETDGPDDPSGENGD